jgi:signal peptidase
VLRGASRLLFALAVCGVLGVVAVLIVLPRASGGSALTVLTGSMTPDIPVGSVVLIRPVDPRALEVGDVATYQVAPDSRDLITHRVIEVTGSGDDLRYVFKGDANRGADLDPVPPEAVRGEVWFHVPYVGTLRDAMGTRGGVALALVLGLGGYAVLQLAGGVRDRRRRPEDGQDPAVRRIAAARPGVVAVLRQAAGDDPGATAAAWDAVVLEHDDSTVTLLVLPPVGRTAGVADALLRAGAERVETWDDVKLAGNARVTAQMGEDHVLAT